MGIAIGDIPLSDVKKAIYQCSTVSTIGYGVQTGTTELTLFRGKNVDLTSVSKLQISGLAKVSGGTGTLKMYAGAGTSNTKTFTNAAFDWFTFDLDVSGVSSEVDVYLNIYATAGDTASINTVTINPITS